MTEHQNPVGNYEWNGREFPIIHHRAHQYFSITIDGSEARLSYSIKENTWNMYRTFTPPSLRGMGVAAAITEAALEEAKREGVRVLPSCSYVDWYIDEHQEFSDLL